jgi:hypothetical protein
MSDVIPVVLDVKDSSNRQLIRFLVRDCSFFHLGRWWVRSPFGALVGQVSIWGVGGLGFLESPACVQARLVSKMHPVYAQKEGTTRITVLNNEQERLTCRRVPLGTGLHRTPHTFGSCNCFRPRSGRSAQS